MFYFLALVAQLIRRDPGATRQKYAGKKSHEVHTVLCHQIDLPVFVLVTPAHVHDSQVGWFMVFKTCTKSHPLFY
jgi:hypothetical protein